MNRLGTPPHVCLITPGESNSDNFHLQKEVIVQTIGDAVRDGVGLIQIREKQLTTRLLAKLVEECRSALSGTDATLLVNERTDVALAAGADGVHLPESSLPVPVARKDFPNILIGASVHSITSAETAVRGGADLILYGPVFDTPGKGPATGLDSLADVCRGVQGFPVIALGGIDESNCVEVIEAGAAGIAAIRALNDADSRRRLLERLRTARMD